MCLYFFRHSTFLSLLMSFSNSRHLYFLSEGVFNCKWLTTSDSFLSRLHYFQPLEVLDAERRIWKGPTHNTCGLFVKTGVFAGIYAVSPSLRIHATAFNKARKLKVTSLAGRSLTYLKLRVFLPANCMYFRPRLWVFSPACAGVFTFDC